MAIGTTAAILGASAIGAGASLYSGSKSSSAANNATASQTAQIQQMQPVIDEQVALAKMMRNRYSDTYAPLEDSLIEQVQNPARENADYLGTMAGINRNYANAEANARRTMAGRTPWGSGLEGAKQTSLELNRTRDIAKTEANYNAQRTANLMSLASLGRNLPSQAQSGYSGALSGMSSAANMYGNQATNYNNAASQAYGSVGNIAGNMAQMYMLNNALGGTSSGAIGGGLAFA